MVEDAGKGGVGRGASFPARGRGTPIGTLVDRLVRPALGGSPHVASKICGTAGAMGLEANEMTYWLFSLGTRLRSYGLFPPIFLTVWIPPPLPWSAYCVLMACRLVALDKRQGLIPVGIGEMLFRDLVKLVMRVEGD